MPVDASAKGNTTPELAVGGVAEGTGIILVVEGTPVDRTVLCRALEGAPLLITSGPSSLSGYAVLAVSTGASALNCVQRRRPVACILLGRSLPDMSRVDFLGALRAEPGSVAARVPVVVLTPPGDRHAAVTMLRAGAQEYLPWDDRTSLSDPDALARAIRTALTGAQLSREVREGEARFRETFEQAPVGIGHVDPETGAWLRVNRQLAGLTGETPEEMAEFSPFASLFGFEAADVAGEGPREVRLSSSEAEGKRWASVTVSRPDGADYLIAAVEDITARRLAERDRHIAQILQASLLPVVTAAASPELEVAATCVPVLDEAEVGGDFYDVFPLTGGRTALAVGDVMGKGLEAALSIAEVRFALRGFLREDPDPSLALRRLNRFLLEAQRLEGRPRNALVALSLAVVDSTTGVAEIVVAGAETPLLLRRTTNKKVDGSTQIEAIGEGDLLLGAFPEVDYRSQTVQLYSGDLLAFATDGVTEARRSHPAHSNGANGTNGVAKADGPVTPDILFGSIGLAWALRAESVSSPGSDIHGAAWAVADRVRAFAGGKLSDDLCLLLVRRL